MDGMVTSGVFSVVVEAFHSRGIQAATYDLFNGSGVKPSRFRKSAITTM